MNGRRPRVQSCVCRRIAVRKRGAIQGIVDVDLQARAGLQRAIAAVFERIVFDQSRELAGITNDSAAGQLVDERVIFDNDFAGLATTIDRIVDNRAVAGSCRLCDRIAFDQHAAASGDINGVGGVAGAVVEDRVADDQIVGDALYVMTLDCILDGRVLDK